MAEDGAARQSLPPTPPRRVAAAALALALVTTALFFAPAFSSDRQFLLGDTGRMHHPMKGWIAGELGRGHWPEWNPLLGLGAPVTAGAIDGLLHPFTLLLVLLPFETAFRSWVLLSYALAVSGAFLWARQLGASPAGAATAGLALALSGFMVSSSSNLTFLTGLAALPLLLCAVHGWVRSPGPAGLLAVGAAAWLAASAGDPQSFGLVVLGLPLYGACLVEGGTGGWQRALLGAAGSAVALAAASPVLLPVASWLPHSSRGEPLTAFELGQFNLHPLRLVELAIPFLVRPEPGAVQSIPYMALVRDGALQPWVASVHVGASVLLLAGVGAWRHRAARWLLLAAALATWMALGPHGGFAFLAHSLPLLGRFRYWEKLAVFIPLLVAPAAALGFDALVRGEPGSRRLGIGCGAVGALLLAASAVLFLGRDRTGVVLSTDALLQQAAPLLISNLIEGLALTGTVLVVLAVLLFSWTPARRAGPALLVAVVVLELFAASSGAWATSPVALAEEPPPLARDLAARGGRQRVVTPFFEVAADQARRPGLTEYEATWRWFGRNLHPAINVGWGVANFEDYLALVPARASRFHRRAGDQHLLPNVGLWGVQQVIVPLDPSLGERLGLHAPYRVLAVDAALPAFAVELPHRPRAYLASELVEVDRRAAMEFALSADPGSPRSVIEGALPAGYRPPTGSATLTIDEGEQVAVAVQVDTPALLVLNDALAEGWTASVDGRPANILPTNYLARGVWVGRGDRLVTFRYRTPGLALGLLVSALVPCAAAAWWLVRRRGEEQLP